MGKINLTDWHKWSGSGIDEQIRIIYSRSFLIESQPFAIVVQHFGISDRWSIKFYREFEPTNQLLPSPIIFNNIKEACDLADRILEKYMSIKAFL
jgi:hypothetical protein